MEENDLLENLWVDCNMLLKCTSSEQPAMVQDRDKWHILRTRKKIIYCKIKITNEYRTVRCNPYMLK